MELSGKSRFIPHSTVCVYRKGAGSYRSKSITTIPDNFCVQTLYNQGGLRTSLATGLNDDVYWAANHRKSALTPGSDADRTRNCVCKL